MQDLIVVPSHETSEESVKVLFLLPERRFKAKSSIHHRKFWLISWGGWLITLASLFLGR